jgi:hypothetical protein
MISCSSSKNSDRDARVEQIRVNATIKRKELRKIVGQFEGVLSNDSRSDKAVFLNLEVKDEVHEEEGELDSILIPNLAGYLSFNFGTKDGVLTDKISFSISKANYSDADSHLDLVVANSEFGEIQLDLSLKNNSLMGSWIAENSSLAGDVAFNLVSKIDENTLGPVQTLAGRYEGTMQEDGKDNPLLSDLLITTTFNPPDSLVLSATLKVYLTDRRSSEFSSYKFDQVQYNPLLGELAVRGAETKDIILEGLLSNGEYSGRWSSTNEGEVGNIKFLVEGKNATEETAPNIEEVPESSSAALRRGQ